MNKLLSFLALAALAAIASAEEYHYEPQDAYEIYSPAEIVYELHRSRRETKPEEKKDDGKWVFNPNLGKDDDEEKPDEKKWVFNPNLGRDEDGNTRGTFKVERKGENHDVHAGWGKVVDGPDQGESNWYVGGTIKWD